MAKFWFPYLFSNNEDCDFNIWDLIHNLMLEFENTNHFKLYHIEQQIDIDFYLNLIDSNNFDIVGSIFNIFSICIINFPDFYDEFTMELWEKIMINYNYYPINIKSKAINCLSHLLNPILNLPDDIVCDCRLIDIIINHLYINDFEDTVNLLFILQILIFISIKTDQEDQLRKVFIEYELADVIEEINNDEIINELKDESIENILFFINQ